METDTKSAKPGWSGRTGVVALALVSVAASAGWAANCLSEVIWNLAAYAIRMVPLLVFVAAQGAQAHGFGQCSVLEYFPNLISCVSTILVFGAMR
jgi:hypothetical protein